MSVVQGDDVDMDDTEYAEPTPHRPMTVSPAYLEPGPLQPDPIATSILGRMPTPIQPSFAVQVRGNNWGGAAGNVMHTAPSPVPSAHRPGLHPFGLHAIPDGSSGAAVGYPDQSVPRSLDHAAIMNGWGVPQTRSLPSPISETGAEDLGSPDMVLDGLQVRSNSVDNSYSLPPLRPHHHHFPPSSTMMAGSRAGGLPSALREQAFVSVGDEPHACNGAATMDMDPQTPPPRKGHSRSRHTVNSWTLQPGMKKSFSIGYRADCDKCRDKVPGHFNHIIVS